MKNEVERFFTVVGTLHFSFLSTLIVGGNRSVIISVLPSWSIRDKKTGEKLLQYRLASPAKLF